jgi:flagellum-specific ATP synthase
MFEEAALTRDFAALISELGAIEAQQRIGRIARIGHDTLVITGLSDIAQLGDRLVIRRPGGLQLSAEVIAVAPGAITALPEGEVGGCALHDPVFHHRDPGISPDGSWLGRIIDPFGNPIDGGPPLPCGAPRPLRAAPPPATRRRGLGARLETGLAVFNTLLPLARGQRIGLFAGSGVGKTTLLGQLAKGIAADVVVIAMIGERGREVRAFVESSLGAEAARRAVVIAATSDQSALLRRRAAWAALSVAEHFRDGGAHVLLVMDSITRLAEAHRDIALSSGEQPGDRGFPPSTGGLLTSLAERAGPGMAETGDITAIFSVLVAGSDMDEPVADMLRGVLDGHVVLDRAIAERGRFPAIDLLRSVSRSLPGVATAEENARIAEARRLLGAHARAEMMIQAGLYARGSDPLVDEAVRVWPALDAFLAEPEPDSAARSFGRLAALLAPAAALPRGTRATAGGSAPADDRQTMIRPEE